MIQKRRRPTGKVGRRDLPGRADRDVYATQTLRSQYIARLGIPIHLASLIGELCFGEAAQ